MAEDQRGRPDARTRRGAVAAAKSPPTTAAAPVQQRQRHIPRPDRLPGTERAVYEDETGRRWVVLVPEGRAQDAALGMGMVIGPPDMREALAHLPEALQVRLHNELFVRGLLTEHDLRGRAGEVQSALQSALRLDVQTVVRAYRGTDGNE